MYSVGTFELILQSIRFEPKDPCVELNPYEELATRPVAQPFSYTILDQGYVSLLKPYLQS